MESYVLSQNATDMKSSSNEIENKSTNIHDVVMIEDSEAETPQEEMTHSNSKEVEIVGTEKSSRICEEKDSSKAYDNNFEAEAMVVDEKCDKSEVVEVSDKKMRETSL